MNLYQCYLTSLVSDIEDFARCILNYKWPKGLLFHNLEHTTRVIQAGTTIGHHNQLSRDEMEILLAALWLHDLGYGSLNPPYESKSVQIAKRFIDSLTVDSHWKNRVLLSIQATAPWHRPETIVEQCLYDAEYSYMASDHYDSVSQSLKHELEFITNSTIGEADWVEQNLRLLERHVYHTDYGRIRFEPLKKNNMNLQRKKLEAIAQKNYRQIFL